MSSTQNPDGLARGSRRAFLGGGIAALGAGALGGYAWGHHVASGSSSSSLDLASLRYEFRGEHQGGILTPQQQQMQCAAFDVLAESRTELVSLLTDWTVAAEKMCNGDPVGEPLVNENVPTTDTGETYGMGPWGLTITFGFGGSLFTTDDGRDRFGLASRRPKALLNEIPRMAAEKLDPATCNGDLFVEACAEDPMVAMHAIHNLSRIAFGRAAVRWGQLGYGRTSSTSKNQSTPRNLFGFKDGTDSLKAEDGEQLLNDHVWISPDDDAGAYLSGGCYLACRKISMMMEVWDELILSDQQTVIGRDKLEGAPLSGGTEFTAPDFGKTSNGALSIASNSHLALMHPDHNDGAHMLRRGYNFMEGNDSLGRLRGGLFFIAAVRDPKRNFLNILEKMSGDQLTEYLQTTGSGLFVCPPGIGQHDDYVGQRLFEG